MRILPFRAVIKAEQALRESEEHYRSLFENMMNGFAYCRMIFEEDQPKDFIFLKVNNGFINVYSEPGKGSTFKIYLHRETQEETQIGTTHKRTEPLTGTETVLLVEDEAALLKISRRILERLGYTVLSTAKLLSEKVREVLYRGLEGAGG